MTINGSSKEDLETALRVARRTPDTASVIAKWEEDLSKIVRHEIAAMFVPPVGDSDYLKQVGEFMRELHAQGSDWTEMATHVQRVFWPKNEPKVDPVVLAAAILKAYIDARSKYLHVDRDSFNDPGTSESDRWMLCEMMGMDRALNIIEEPDGDHGLGLPSWVPEWETIVANVRKGFEENDSE